MYREPEDEPLQIFLPESDDADDADLGEIDDLSVEDLEDPDRTSGPDLDAVFASLTEGKTLPSMLVGFSDLGRHQLSDVRRQWAAIPVATRESATRELSELTEERLDYHFGRFFRIALEDESPVVRQYALAGLWNDESADFRERLLTLLRDDPSVDVRIQAALGLAPVAEKVELGEVDAEYGERLRESLFDALEDMSEPITLRRRILEAASVFANDPRLDLYIDEMYEDEDLGSRASAIYAMGRSLDPRFFTTILNEFAHDDAEVRYEAAKAIGQYGDTAALPGLGELAKDEDAEVRQAAIAAIGDIGGQPAARLLQKLQAEAETDAELDALDEAMMEAAILDDDLSDGAPFDAVDPFDAVEGPDDDPVNDR